MKMCILIKLVSGTHWAQGLMLVMINIGREAELQPSEDKASFSNLLSPSRILIIFQPLFQVQLYVFVCMCL